MRILIVFCMILSAALKLAAADPEFYGTLLAAQNEKNPRIRAGLIVSALENNRMPSSDRNALRMLNEAFNNTGFDRNLLLRLISAVKKRPDDLYLALFTSDCAGANDLYSPELADAVISCVKRQNFNTMPPAKQRDAAKLLYAALWEMCLSGKYRECAGIMDDIRRNSPDNIPLLKIQISLDVHSCFRENDTAPLLKKFAALPADDFWKKRIAAAAGEIMSLIPADTFDARDIIRIMMSLQMPDTPEKLKAYANAFPADIWSDISSIAAWQYDQKDLFIPGKSRYSNFIGYLRCRNFRAAKRCIKPMNQVPNFECTMILKSAQGEHDEVIKMLYKSPVPLNKIFPATFARISESLYAKKELILLKRIQTVLFDAIRKNGYSDPIACNAIGYTAAELSVDLPKAEALIRYAVKLYPRVASFRDSLAWVLYRQGKFAEAEKEIDSAIYHRDISASVSVLYLHAARIKQTLNKRAEAKACLEKAKKIYEPDNPVCHEYDLECQKRLEKLLQ